MHLARLRHSSAVFFTALLAIITLDLANASRYKHYHRVPIINIDGAEELVGSIAEDERVVSLFPKLRVLPETGPICHYELNPVKVGNGPNHNKDFPFESSIVNKTEGTVKIVLRDGFAIDCSNKEWHMELIAVRCGDESAKSEPVTLKVTVKDTNNHDPVFEAPWYTFETDEGKVSEIARIYATDADCGHPYGKICQFEITNNKEKYFEIDNQGILSNTQPLNYSMTKSHVLTVVAHDCGMRRSRSALVTVHVHPKCTDGLTTKDGKRSFASVQYLPENGPQRIVTESSKIVMCSRENTCEVKQAEVKVALQVEPKTEVSMETAKKCGIDSKTLELIPQAPALKESNEEKIKLTLPGESDDEDEPVAESSVEQQASYFDGKSKAISVPRNKIVPQVFTLSFLMKHEAGSKEEQAVKQNLLCETDDFGMNRHHFAVYLRHCKLELLLRREAEGSAPEFRAAEWRWETPAVCDGNWHSYAIQFSNLDNVTLLVDGQKLAVNERNPEILDDWPLHSTQEHKTKMVVGACWHGRSQAMVQFFKGQLSSMYLLAGSVEQESVIRCMHASQERLSIHSIDQMRLGESVVFNHDQSQVSLKANSLNEVATLLREVEYSVDSRSPLALSKESSERMVAISTKVTCTDKNRTIPLGTHNQHIRLVHPDAPRLSVSGMPILSSNRDSLKTGCLMLPNLQLTATQSIDGVQNDITENTKLDWCKVHLKPSRDMDLEYFSSPAQMIAQLNVEFEHDKEGMLLKGLETAKAYMNVLAQIHYFNTRPETYNKRMYTVHCAMQGGKIVSNEFSVTLNIVNDEELDEVVEKLTSLSKKLDINTNVDTDAELLKMEKHYEPAFDQLGANRLQNILEMDLPRPKALLSHHGYEVGGQGAVAGGAVAVVVVICIGFLLILLVIGVVKMRDHPLPRRRRSRKPTMEGMEWDDMMNITVNPLEDVNKSNQNREDLYSEEESLEDEESYRGEEEDELTDDDDEETALSEVLPHAENGKQLSNGGLEWDDDTDPMMSGGIQPAKTYRV